MNQDPFISSSFTSQLHLLKFIYLQCNSVVGNRQDLIIIIVVIPNSRDLKFKF